MASRTASESHRISFSTLACPDWTWFDVLRNGRPYGYDGVEIRLLARETNLLAVADLQKNELPTRRRELHEAGFQVAGLASSVRFDHETQVARDEQHENGLRYIDLCVELEAGFIRVFGDTLPAEQGGARQIMLQQVADGLRRLGDVAQKAGVMILLETHGDFSASVPCVDVMLRVSHSHVGLVWDTHHPWRFHGEKLADTWEQLRPWTRHTHWKDSISLPAHEETAEAAEAARVASQLMSGHQRADYVLFRGGEFPAIECMKLLIDGGYSGWHSLEWEKMWHPELLAPEIALPLFPIKVRELLQACHRFRE